MPSNPRQNSSRPARQYVNLLLATSILLLIGSVLMAGTLYDPPSPRSGIQTGWYGVVAVCMAAVGVLGIANRTSPKNGALLFRLGLGLIVVEAVSVILAAVVFPPTGGATDFVEVAGREFFGFLISIFFTVGANQLKRQYQT